MVVVKDDVVRRKLKKIERDFMCGDEDSKLPALFLNEMTGEVSSVAYKVGNKRYYFSDEYGYTAYRWDNKKNRPKTWQTTSYEFEESCLLMRKMVEEADDDLKEIYMGVLGELDYKVGHDNAMFYVAPDIENKCKVGTIRFNFRNIFYSLSYSSGVLVKGCIDDYVCKHKEVKGLEKKLILGVMKYSDVVSSKIAEIERGISK